MSPRNHIFAEGQGQLGGIFRPILSIGLQNVRVSQSYSLGGNSDAVLRCQ